MQTMSFSPLKRQEQDQSKGNTCNAGHIQGDRETLTEVFLQGKTPEELFKYPLMRKNYT